VDEFNPEELDTLFENVEVATTWIIEVQRVLSPQDYEIWVAYNGLGSFMIALFIAADGDDGLITRVNSFQVEYTNWLRDLWMQVNFGENFVLPLEFKQWVKAQYGWTMDLVKEGSKKASE
jgi:hypothetical protein